MERLKALGPPVLSGLLLLLAFPPFDLAPFLLVGLVPLLFSLTHSSGRGAWRRGYAFGLVFAVGRLHFIEALTARWTGSIVLGCVPWLIAALMMAVYFGLVSVAMRTCLARGMPWLVPLVWAGMEAFRSYVPVFAFPWALLASPLWRYPVFIQEARLGTIFLVGAWVVLADLGVLFVLTGDRRRARVAAGVASLTLVVSLTLYLVGPATASVPVAIGQTGVDMAFGDPGQQDARSSLAVEQLESAAKSAGCRLLVLPEGVARVRRLARDVPFRVDPAVPIVFGAQRGSGPIYQSAVGFDGRWQYVDKTRLVIFGEFVPGRDFLPFLSAFHLASGDISAGTGGTKAMTIGGLPVGPIICFEALFPDIAWKQSLNGAHMLAVISIDDWFMGSSAPDELRAGTVWRAVETGLPVVRAATLGWSLAADGHGNILVEAPMGATEAPRVQLPVPDHPLVGYWLPVFPALSLLTLLALPWLRRRESTLR